MWASNGKVLFTKLVENGFEIHSYDFYTEKTTKCFTAYPNSKATYLTRSKKYVVSMLDSFKISIFSLESMEIVCEIADIPKPLLNIRDNSISIQELELLEFQSDIDSLVLVSNSEIHVYYKHKWYIYEDICQVKLSDKNNLNCGVEVFYNKTTKKWNYAEFVDDKLYIQ